MNIEPMKERLNEELIKVGLKLLPPNDEFFAEEMCRTCLIDPPIERVYMLPTRKVLFNNRLLDECGRIFDITTTSGRGNALYNIEDLKRLTRLGHDLRNGYLVHPHHHSINPTPSITDVISFFVTDAALGVHLNYLVISATRDAVMVKAIDFKHCYECTQFSRYLNGAPLVDSVIGQEVEGQ